jgi:hypothetical protein
MMKSIPKSIIRSSNSRFRPVTLSDMSEAEMSSLTKRQSHEESAAHPANDSF